MDDTSLDKYKKAFVKAFDVKVEILSELKYDAIPEWDSIGHMMLISELEDAFNITLETNDIIDFSSYEKGKEIIEKYI